MKILMVNKFLFPNGGSETYIFKVGDYLKSIGHEVQYFGMEHPKRCVGNAAEQYTENMDFHTGKLKKLKYPFKIIYSTEAKKKMDIVLRSFFPDAVHLNNFNFQLTPSLICSVKEYEKETGKKIKIIYTAHDYQLICPNHMMNNPSTLENCEKCVGGKFINCTKGKCIHGSAVKSALGTLEGYFWKAKKIYQQIDCIICPTQFMKSKMDTNPLFAEKTVVLYNFIDQIKHKPSEKKDYILYFGRFSREKGILTLINVCKQLPNIPFVFAGSGPLEEQIKDTANIKNAGFQTGRALEQLIREARFSIYPSEWYENCPFSVMESQMYGTPVLGADIGGIPELITNQTTGELFESGNENDLKQKIERLWNNKAITKQYSKNCQSASFDTLEKYCSKLMNLYSAPSALKD